MATSEKSNITRIILKRTRILLLVVFLFVFVWLFYKNFAPTGKLVLKYNFDKEPKIISFVRGIDNPEKSIGGNVTYSRITENPAEFQLNMPRLFDKAEIEIKYIGSYPTLYLSSKKKNSNYYKTKLLTMDLSNNEDWKRMADKDRDLVLYQRYSDQEQEQEDEEGNETYIKPEPEFKYDSIDNFINDMGNIVDSREDKIAYFNYDLSDKVKILDYKPSTEILTFDKIIRGKHKIVTYLGEGEKLDFNFYYQDTNKYDGPDRFNVLIDKNNDTIARYTEEDDGDELASGITSEMKNVHIKRDDLGRGVYIITLDISDDLYVHKIETRQKYFAFQNQLFLENSKQKATLYTNAQSLYFKTLHEGALGQNIKSERLLDYDKIELEDNELNKNKEIDSEKIEAQLDLYKINRENEVVLEETMENYNLPTRGVINKVDIPINDVVITYGGLLSDNVEAIDKLSALGKYIYPLDASVNLEETDYIITDYFEEARKEGPYRVVSQKIDLESLEISDKNEINFSLNIDNYNRNNSDLKLSKIKFILKKDPWNPTFFKDKLSSLFK